MFGHVCRLPENSVARKLLNEYLLYQCEFYHHHKRGRKALTMPDLLNKDLISADINLPLYYLTMIAKERDIWQKFVVQIIDVKDCIQLMEQNKRKILESFVRRVIPRIDSSSYLKKRKLIQNEKEKYKGIRKFAIFLNDCCLCLMHCNILESFAQYRIVMSLLLQCLM